MVEKLQGKWIKKTNSVFTRHDHVCYVYNHKMYAISGANYETLTSVEIYDPVTDQWSGDASPIPIARGWYGGAQLGNMCYVIGGKQIRSEFLQYQRGETFEFYNLVDAYNPITNTWQSVQPLPQKRVGTAATSHKGKLYLMGGVFCGVTLDETVRMINDLTEIYDPASNIWSKGPDLPLPLMYPSIQSDGHHIYVIGGFYDGIHRNEVYRLLPEKGIWETMTPMNYKRSNCPSIISGNKIFVFGGCSNETGFTSTCEMYNIDTNEWFVLPELPKAKAWAGAAIIEGRIFVHGGANRDNDNGELPGEGHYSWYFKNELHEFQFDEPILEL